MVPTSEKERRLCGPGIFRVAPEKESFNTIGQDREGCPYSAPTRRRGAIPSYATTISRRFRGISSNSVLRKDSDRY